MKRVFVLWALICVFVSTPVFAEQAQQIVINEETLMQMSDQTRNALFAEVKKQSENQNISLSDETLKKITNMDVDIFKGKALAIGDTINEFFQKIGMSVNDFIKTPAGNLIILGALYKMGIFGSIWAFGKFAILAIVFLILLYRINTTTKIQMHLLDNDGKVLKTHEVIRPKFSAIFSDDADEFTTYSVISSIVCVIVIVVAFCNM